jgi:thioredoxin reductase
MVTASEFNNYDTIIIGGGQAGLSAAYFLKKTNLKFIILDNQTKPGGAWLHTWYSLKLFSPSTYSSLSGWQMPPTKNEYPTKEEFVNYLEEYEKRYDFPIKRDTHVINVSKNNGSYQLDTNNGKFFCRSVVSATGTAQSPYIPKYPKCDTFKGTQLHSVDYINASEFKNKKVLVVGAGNSGAQILADVSKATTTKWVTIEPPVFLPEDIDGRHLFAQANAKYLKQETDKDEQKVSLSNIVQVESVKEGLANGIYNDHRPFKTFYEDGVVWNDHSKEAFDIVIWCTGFKPNLRHLQKLNIVNNDKIKTKYTHSLSEPGLWLIGYGNWTGFASATIYGVGKTAKKTVKEITDFFNDKAPQQQL